MGMKRVLLVLAVFLIAALPKEYKQPESIPCPPGPNNATPITFDSDELIRLRVACFITSEPLEVAMFFTEQTVTQDNPKLPFHSFSGWTKDGDSMVAYFMSAENMGQFVLRELSAGGTFIEVFKLEVPDAR